MGNPMREGTKKHEKSKRRGSTNNGRRLDTFRKGVGSVEASWGDCDAGLLQVVVVGITALGGAVTFGLSRDRGAHSATLMLDGERETIWVNRDADLDDALRLIIGTLEAMA